MAGFDSIQALAAFGLGQQAAEKRRAQERDEAKLQGLSEAYDTTTGQMDPARARQAYVQGGDLEGAMRFDQGQSKAAADQLELHKDRIIFGAGLLQGVRDETSYQAVRSQMQAAGMPVDDIPTSYDPQYVQNVIGAAKQLQAKEAQPTSLERNYEFYQRVAPDLAPTYLKSEAMPRPIVDPTTGGLVMPNFGSPAPAANAPQPGTIEDGYEFLGGDPSKPESWRKAGGPTPQASGAFPG